MATNFYKYGGSYYEQDSHKKISDLNTLNSYAQAGGKEINYTPDKSWQKIANESEIKNYDVKGQYGSTLYGTLKQIETPKVEVDPNNVTASLPDSKPVDLAMTAYARRAQENADKQAEIQAAKLAESKKESERLNKEREALKIKETELMGEYDQNTTAYAQDINEKYNEQFKSEQMIQDNIDVTNEIRELGKSLESKMGLLEGKTISRTAYNAKSAKINSDYMSDLAIKQSFLAANQNNISLVRNYISDAVGYIQQDRDNRIQFLNVALSLNSGELADVENDIDENKSEQNSIIQNLINEFEAEKQQVEENKDWYIDNMEDPEMARIINGSGVSLTDTPEIRAEKLSKYYQKHPELHPDYIDPGTLNLGADSGLVSTTTGDVYDIGSYATDPTHEAKIQSILKDIGQFFSVADIDAYIQKVAPGSPITGEMVKNASDEYGVSWEMMVAIMQQDSSLGTAGIGARNFNPGNIGQFDSLGTTPTDGYKSWQEGVNAVAKNLAWRKTDAPEQTMPQEVISLTDMVNSGKITNKQALDEVSPENKTALIDSLAITPNPQDTEQDEIAKEKAKLAVDLKSHAGIGESVGATKATRFDWWAFSGAKEDFIAKVDQLVSNLSLDSLIDAKSRGATFGALSEKEMQILASAATKIGTWQLKNKKGNTVGYDIDEKSFKAELDNIAKIFNRAIKSQIGTEPEGNTQTMSDGTTWIDNSDGTYTLVQ